MGLRIHRPFHVGLQRADRSSTQRGTPASPPGARRSLVLRRRAPCRTRAPYPHAAHLRSAGRTAADRAVRRAQAGSPVAARPRSSVPAGAHHEPELARPRAVGGDRSRSIRQRRRPLRCRDVGAETPAEPARERRLRHVLEAAHELLVRTANRAIVGRRFLNAPTLVKEYLAVLFAGAEREFVVVFLDAQLRVIAAETMFTGTLTHTSVYRARSCGARCITTRRPSCWLTTTRAESSSPVAPMSS